ncbi:TRAP transporter large permease [Seohaeicola nanhaiensis]|uniref:TRAP transporter large permease n=1 Tax=Seohaeicola nanhaiensis TaxID=1387282 RepID=A0ABV9KHH3_9RHOB
MSDLAIGIWSFPALLVLIFLRVPIGLAMFVTAFVGLWLTQGVDFPLLRMKNEVFSTFGSYSLSIVPMFLLMGHFATLGGMSTALFKAAEGFLGHRKGGVAMAAIGACAGFGSICGSSLATAATMGRVALPELRQYGYAGGFSTATLAAGGTLGILIPPSVVLVIFAILTEQNIAKLFLAAFIPGVLAAIGYVIAISIYVRIHPESAGTRPPMPMADRFWALLHVWPVLLVFGLVVGGIYLGWFSPTEGAAVGAMGTGLIALLNGGLNRHTLVESFVVTGRSTAMIFFIILGAAFYNGFLAITKLPDAMVEFILAQGYAPITVLIVILIFYLIFGCVMDSLSMILLTIPVFWPVIQSLDFHMVTLETLHAERAMEAIASGVDLAQPMLDSIKQTIADGALLTKDQISALGIRVSQGMANRIDEEYTAIWFGILVLIVVEVGLITPPVGMNLFIINSMDQKTPILETYKAVMYFVATDLFRVALLVAVPAITLFLLPL